MGEIALINYLVVSSKSKLVLSGEEVSGDEGSMSSSIWPISMLGIRREGRR